MNVLHSSVIDTLKQVEILINTCDEQTYAQVPECALSSIGQHMRHILDHFMEFQEGIEKGLINYNNRSRGSGIETSRDIALQKAQQISAWFRDYVVADKNIRIETEVAIDHTENMVIDSTIERELCYLINHTIHHVAYATLLVKQFDLKIEHELGIAPATATYLRSQAYS